MIDFNNPVYWPVYASMILLPGVLYFRFSRSRRGKQLGNLGFSVSTDVTKRLKIQLQKYANGFMEGDKGIGCYATYGSVLVWWCAKRKINNKRIYCWCFRRVENGSGKPVEKWYMGVYIDKVSVTEQSLFIRKAKQRIGESVYFENGGDTVFVMFPSPLFCFSPIILFLKDVINEVSDI